MNHLLTGTVGRQSHTKASRRLEKRGGESDEDGRTTGSSAEESGMEQREERRTDSEAVTALQAYH